MNLKRKALLFFALAVLLAGAASATPITFSGSSGSLSASATFDVSGTDLVVTLTNTSEADVLAPSDVLTAVFFNVGGNVLFSPISAIVAPGSTVEFAPYPPGGVVGGEWAYKNGLSGAPLGANEGLSSTGLNWFGPSDLFPGPNLAGPLSPDGVQYGLTSAGDDPLTGNTAVTAAGQNPLIKNSVVFTLGNVPAGFDAASISGVWFQYGTSMTEPGFTGNEVPEPGTVGLLGAGLLLLGARFKRSRTNV